MNSNKILPFLWITAFFFLQNAFCFTFALNVPALLLIAVLFYAFSEGPGYGAVLGAYAGLLMEIFSVGKIGGDIFVFSLAGFLFGRASKTFFRESIFSQFLFPALIFYCVLLIRLIFLHIGMGESVGFSVIREAFLPWEMAGVCLALPVIFFFLKKVS